MSSIISTGQVYHHVQVNISKNVHEKTVVDHQVNTNVNIEKNVYNVNHVTQEDANTVHQKIDIYV